MEVDAVVARCVEDDQFRSKVLSRLRKMLKPWVQMGPGSSYGTYWGRYNLLNELVANSIRYEDRRARDRYLSEEGYIFLPGGDDLSLRLEIRQFDNPAGCWNPVEVLDRTSDNQMIVRTIYSKVTIHMTATNDADDTWEGCDEGGVPGLDGILYELRWL